MERVAGSEKTIAPVPVTVLAGFLGAGKTTVLTSLLAARGDLRIAVVVNDLAEGSFCKLAGVNVDARQLRQLDGSVPMAHFAELHSGCVCCSAGGDDLLGAIEWLVGSEGDADAHSDSPRPPAGANPDDPQGGGLHAIVVECSGVAEPVNIVEMFEAAREHSHPATAKAYLDAVVTVVDAGTVLEWLDSVGQAATAQQQQQPRPGQMAQLLVEQIECAHVIVLNKSDRVPHSKLATCCAAVAALNPTADLHTARFGVVPKEALVRTGRRQRAQAAKYPPHPHHHVHAPAAAPSSAAGAAAAAAATTATSPAAAAAAASSPSHAKEPREGPALTGDRLADGRGGDHGHEHVADGARSGVPSGGAARAQGGTALEGAVWSFVYRGRRPFHPERLNALVKRLRKALTQPPLPPPVTSAPARAVPTGHNAESAASSPSETSQSHIGSSPAEGAERVERAERVGSAGSAERAAGRAQGSLPQAEIASGSGGSACELGGAGARASRGEVGAAQAPGGVALHAEQEKGSTMMMLHGVLRAKGLVWVASCMDKSREWAYAGGVLELQHGSPWLEKEEEEKGERPAERCDEVARTGVEGGSNGLLDRRQEIVFIGTREMREGVIREALDGCLLDPEEMEGGPDKWRAFRDPIALTLSTAARARAAATPPAHGAGCPCCDPSLKEFDRLVFGGVF